MTAKKTEYNRQYYLKNKEKIKGQANGYYRENRDAVLETVKKYRDANRPIIQEKGRKYYRRKLENRMLNAARARAKKYNLEFDIDVSDIVVPETCPLLGIPLFVADGRKSVKYNSASLDRIDPTKGYVKGNVWVISFKANTMKSNATLDEFLLMSENWKKHNDSHYVLEENNGLDL